MSRPRTVAIVLGGAAAGVVAASAVVRHVRGGPKGGAVPGGIVVGDAAVYDAASRLVLGPFLRRIAVDVAEAAPEGARVLEIGCGPGHLSIMLARSQGLDVTGGPRPGDGRTRTSQRRPLGERSRPRAHVRGRRRGLARVPRRVVRSRREHAVDASLGRPERGPGGDRPGAPSGRAIARVGLAARGRALPPRRSRSAWIRTRGSPQVDLGEAVALATRADADAAARAGPGGSNQRSRTSVILTPLQLPMRNAAMPGL
jgi:hypothetical protein